jgi:hypothetical protein
MGIEEPDIDPGTFLDDVEMRVGTVVSVEEFPEARREVYKLEVDFGSESRQSAAGLTDNYSWVTCIVLWWCVDRQSVAVGALQDGGAGAVRDPH